MNDTEPGIRWYPVMCAPRMESVADANLRRQGFYTFYPFERVQRKRKLPNRTTFKLEWVEQPYFPRYLFVAFRGRAGESFGAINETTGVSTAVYFAGAPLEIPPPVMDELMQRAKKGGLMGVVDRTIRKRFSPGQRVKFIDESPFAGFLAAVSLDRGPQVRVWIDELRTSRPVSVPPDILVAV